MHGPMNVKPSTFVNGKFERLANKTRKQRTEDIVPKEGVESVTERNK